MKHLSTMYSILGKFAFLSAVVLFSCLVVFSMLNRQSQYILLGIAVISIPMFFAEKDSSLFKITSSIVFISTYIFFAAQFGRILPSLQQFHFAVFLAVLVFPLLFTKPKWMTYLYITIFMFFPSTNYGMSWGLRETFVEIYGKGAGELHFSFVTLFLFFIMLSVLVHKVLKKGEYGNEFVECNLYKYFWLFNGIFAVYTLIGVGYDVSFWDAISFKGVMSITFMGLFIFVIVQLFRSEEDIEQFVRYFLTCMLARAIYGVYRFIFLHGDPANQYRNYDGSKGVIISFFDYGDNIISCIAVFYSIWVLMKGSDYLSRNWRNIHRLIIIIGTFNMLLSYRRAVWMGMVLVLIWLAQYLKLKQKIVVGLSIIVIFSIVSSFMLINRFGEEAEKSLISGLLPDTYSKTTGEFTIKEGRFYEIYLAWRTIRNNLVFGMGPWGGFEADQHEFARGSGYTFTHSSIIFMLLKMGIVGLLSYLAILAAFVSFWLRVKKEKWHSMSLRALGETGFAGFVFLIPNIFFTPFVPEYRNTQLMGICLALPYVAYYFDRKKATDYSQ